MNLSDTDQAPYSAPTPQAATVSAEAVQVAIDEYYPAFTPSESAHDDMRRALTAALPHLALSAAPCSVEAKKLEWGIPFPHETQERAESIFGTYAIWEIGGSGYYRTPNATSGTPAQGDQTVAKAAAQADFDRRILSQIVTKPVDVAAARRQALEEALLPFSEIAGELFAQNYNNDDVVFSVKAKTAKGSTIAHEVTFKAFANARQAIRALSPAEPVAHWRDIATAPKQGGFLAANSKEVWAAWHYDSENWHAKYGSRGATHWMPLPSAPNKEAGE